MKIFAWIRLGIWAVVLGVCLTVVTVYWTINTTVLNQATLQSWASTSSFYVTLRDDMIAPRLEASADAARPAGSILLPDSAIASALTNSVTADQLAQKATPAIASLRNWLDSRSADITFSIPASDIESALITNLNKELIREVANLPACTSQNSLSDLQNGVCAGAPSFSTSLENTIMSDLTTGGSKIFGDTITQNDVTLPSTITTKAKDLPNYLNLLYTAALFCGGVTIFGGLWILFKKRGEGLIALGSAGVIGGVGACIAGVALHNVAATLSLGKFQQLGTTALDSIQASAIEHGLLLSGVGLACIVFGTGITTLFKKAR